MKNNNYIIKKVTYSSNRGLLTRACYGIFEKEVVRTGFLTIALGVAVLLTSSCASSDGGFKARLITPAVSGEQADTMTSDTYQPPRNPAFDQYLGG